MAGWEGKGGWLLARQAENPDQHGRPGRSEQAAVVTLTSLISQV